MCRRTNDRKSKIDVKHRKNNPALQRI
eukprot:COSAG03_NODE_24884_length_269_cov_0.611765_1_plen_26_part_10